MTGQSPNIERRTLLQGAAMTGVAVAAAGALAACGSDESSAVSTSTTSGTSPTDGGAGAGEVLVPTKDVPEGGGIILADPEVVVTQPTAGEFVAFSSICTHAGCTVDNVDNGTINCTCHQSQFSIEDGSVVAGPAPAPLPPVTVTVDGKSVVRA